MSFWDGFLYGWAKGTLVGGLALIIGFLVYQIAMNVGWPVWVCVGGGVWAFLTALAIGKP